MKQILCIALLCVSFNFANAIIVRTNCPDYNANTHTIDSHCGSFRVNIELELGSPIPLLANYYLVDFKSNMGDIDGIQVNEFSTDIFGVRHFSINVPLAKPIPPQFLFYIQIRDGRNVLHQTDAMDPYLGTLAFNWSDCAGLNILNKNSTLNNTNQDFFKEPLNSKIRIFPNPFIDEFSIEYKGERNELVNIKIFDVNGTLKFSQEQFVNENFLKKISNLNLSKGIYVCRFTTHYIEKSIKLIKM